MTRNQRRRAIRYHRTRQALIARRETECRRYEQGSDLSAAGYHAHEARVCEINRAIDELFFGRRAGA